MRAPQNAAQLEMVVDDPQEVERERQRETDDQQLLFGRFTAACRKVCRELTYDYVANQLDAIWSPLGRLVSPGVLRQTLAPNNERNYFRFEWAIWFARESDEVAELLAEIIGRGKPTKTADEELEDLKDVIANEYPRQAQRLIRRAQTMPRRRRPS